MGLPDWADPILELRTNSITMTVMVVKFQTREIFPLKMTRKIKESYFFTVKNYMSQEKLNNKNSLKKIVDSLDKSS